MARIWIHDPGFELKRSYQRNMLISMALVYGTVILAVITSFLVENRPVEASQQVVLMQGYHPKTQHEAPRLESPRGHGSQQRDGEAREVTLRGMMGVAVKMVVIPDQTPVGMPVVDAGKPAVEIPEPDFTHEPATDELAEFNSTGTGEADYGLPEVPSATYLASPSYPDWEIQRRMKAGGIRAARVYFGGLYWPEELPAGAQCTLFVRMTFNANGRLDWEIQRYALDPRYGGDTLAFKRQLDTAMRRTWFQAGMIDGVKVTQIAELQAIFCPKCEPQAWSERGDMQVFLKK